jgi:hypothetical protein
MTQPPTPEEIRAAEREHDFLNDLGKRLIDGAMRDAQETMKALLLINSGGAVALLAFIGAVVSKGFVRLEDLTPLMSSIVWFMGRNSFSRIHCGLGLSNQYIVFPRQFTNAQDLETSLPRTDNAIETRESLGALPQLVCCYNCGCFTFDVCLRSLFCKLSDHRIWKSHPWKLTPASPFPLNRNVHVPLRVALEAPQPPLEAQDRLIGLDVAAA